MRERLVLRRLHAQELAQRFPALLYLVDQEPLGGHDLLGLLVSLVKRLDHTPTVLGGPVEPPLGSEFPAQSGGHAEFQHLVG